MSTLNAADAAAARRVAASILHEGRFHPASVPRPLHSLLHDLGTLLEAPGRAVASLVNAIAPVLPGGQVTGWILVVAIVGCALALTVRRYSRASLAGGPGEARNMRHFELRAAELERQAEEAERAGEFAEAVRLRFRAGLERLSEQGTIEPAGSRPTLEVAGALRSKEFDQLARRFDEIAYGSTPAGAQDAERSRQGWREVVREARRG